MVTWNNKQPIFQQIKSLIEKQILTGIWPEGVALPSIRTVSSDLKINHLTVMKAYQLLVDEQLVEKKRGLGMFVLPGAQSKLKADKTNEFMHTKIPELIEKLDQLQIPVEQFITELQKQIKENSNETS